MQAKEIVKLVEKLAVPILEKKGLEFVDVEYVKEGASWYLRLYIDKEGGVGIDECVDVSRELDAQLDDDMTEQAYILEVSSPGLGRPLKKEKDFVRNMGKDVEIRTYRSIDRSKEFVGTLKAYDKDSVTITDENGSDRTFLRTDIALIRQAVIW